MIKVDIVKDSISKHTGIRLTTFVLTYHRFIHSELLTHRVFSRNSSSSRAIPTKKFLEKILTEPAMPIFWGKNDAGMSADEPLSLSSKIKCEEIWLKARDSAVAYAEALYSLGLHKQTVNRILEPFMHIQTIVTATDWDNFFKLRRHDSAQPEIHYLADLMYHAMNNSIPNEIDAWHTPFVTVSDYKTTNEALKVSVARCARISYTKHDKEHTLQSDLDLFNKLKKNGHYSPFEHVAFPTGSNRYYGNLSGWSSVRYDIENTNNFDN